MLSFKWNFATDELSEDPMYNDFGFFTISTSAFLLASHDGSTYDTVSGRPDKGRPISATQTYTFPSAGTYTVGFVFHRR